MNFKQYKKYKFKVYNYQIKNILLMKRFKIAKTLNNLRDKFLFCSILMLSVFYSCTKIDVQKKDPKNSILIEDFFKVNKPVSQAVADIILKLKLENERTNFVNNLPKECGTPVWDKLLIQNSSSFASRGSDSLNDIIIPLSINNTCLSSILIFHDSISGNQVDCFTTNTYLYNETHATSVDTSKAMNDLLLFFYMESNTYGTTEFYHIPTNLFSYSHQLGTDGKKIITIQVQHS